MPLLEHASSLGISSAISSSWRYQWLASRRWSSGWVSALHCVGRFVASIRESCVLCRDCWVEKEIVAHHTNPKQEKKKGPVSWENWNASTRHSDFIVKTLVSKCVSISKINCVFRLMQTRGSDPTSLFRKILLEGKRQRCGSFNLHTFKMTITTNLIPPCELSKEKPNKNGHTLINLPA